MLRLGAFRVSSLCPKVEKASNLIYHNTTISFSCTNISVISNKNLTTSCGEFILIRQQLRASSVESSSSGFNFNTPDVGGSGAFMDDGGGLFPQSGISYTDELPRDIAMKLKNAFYDHDNRRCTLCRETLATPWGMHTNYPQHAARMSIVERVLSGLAGDPNKVREKWWTYLSDETVGTSALGPSGWCGNQSISPEEETLSSKAYGLTPFVDYGRLATLSHKSKRQRQRRLFFLIRFLQKRGVIREALGIYRGGVSGTAGLDPVMGPRRVGDITSQSHGSSGRTTSTLSSVVSGFARSYNFERFEMIGDNVVKFIIPDRLFRLFPDEEGGINNGLSGIQQLIDCNEGLRDIYDFLDLDQLIGFRMPNSKSKSDVMESLFGELQCFLWATEVEMGEMSGCGSEQEVGGCLLTIPLSPEMQYLRFLVKHVLNEMTHSVLYWIIDTTIESAHQFIEENYRGPSDVRHYAGQVGYGAVSSTSTYSTDKSSVLLTPGGMVLPPAKPFYTVLEGIKKTLPSNREKAARLIARTYPPPLQLPVPYFKRLMRKADSRPMFLHRVQAFNVPSLWKLSQSSQDHLDNYATLLDRHIDVVRRQLRLSPEFEDKHSPTVTQFPVEADDRSVEDSNCSSILVVHQWKRALQESLFKDIHRSLIKGNINDIDKTIGIYLTEKVNCLSASLPMKSFECRGLSSTPSASPPRRPSEGLISDLFSNGISESAIFPLELKGGSSL